jgi:membrane fusion protein, copper/silver efflux system
MKKPAALATLLFLALIAFAAGRYTGTTSHEAHAGTKRILYYVDPMHPSYRSDKPGIAPDCGMPLEPVYEGEDLARKLQLPAGTVSISPEQQQLIGVGVETVQKSSESRFVRTTGRVEADEDRLYRLMAGTDGFVQTLENNPAGTIVKKNDLLATFYSREFRNAQQAYLGALASVERVKNASQPDDPNSNLRLNEEQLHALGMGDPQIKEIVKTHQITRDIGVVSPIDGIILARNISPQMRFEKGAEFYRIADLSRVWIIADVFEDQARVLRPGSKVKVNVRELSKTLYATVTENAPLFDAASRTLKLRLEADNPGWTLRPDMFVDLEFQGEAPAGLYLPAGAVLDSGLHKIVYVETAEDLFEPRVIEIGPAFGGRVVVTRGLAAGDRVVTSGNFLLDSESRIKTGALRSGSSDHDTHMIEGAAGSGPLDHNTH